MHVMNTFGGITRKVHIHQPQEEHFMEESYALFKKNNKGLCCYYLELLQKHFNHSSLSSYYST